MLIYFLFLLGGRDDTSKSVMGTLSKLWGGATAPPAPQLGTALSLYDRAAFPPALRSAEEIDRPKNAKKLIA